MKTLTQPTTETVELNRYKALAKSTKEMMKVCNSVPHLIDAQMMRHTVKAFGSDCWDYKTEQDVEKAINIAKSGATNKDVMKFVNSYQDDIGCFTFLLKCYGEQVPEGLVELFEEEF